MSPLFVSAILWIDETEVLMFVGSESCISSWTVIAGCSALTVDGRLVRRVAAWNLLNLDAEVLRALYKIRLARRNAY